MAGKVIFFNLSFLLMMTGLLAAGQTVRLEGTLVCSKCYLTDNSLIHNYHFPMTKCGTMCLNNGTPAGLLTQDQEFHAIIAPSSSLADYVGRAIRVSGSLHEGSILATTVEVKEDEKWKKVELRNMM